MSATEEMSISIREAAEIIGVSVKTMRRYADQNKVPYSCRGVRHRI